MAKPIEWKIAVLGENMDELLTKLCQTWHSTIPVSEFMQLRPLNFSAGEFSTTAPIAPNINLHQTMFAGSIYTLMTLTGWGMVWLQQQMLSVEGDIVLADAHIRYMAPVTQSPEVKVRWPDTDLSPLQRGRRVKVRLEVQLFCEAKLCAVFEGLYVSTPKM